MGIARKAFAKVFDGFAKAIGGGLAAAVVALSVWTYGNLSAPKTDVAKPAKDTSSSGDWITTTAIPYYDYIDTWSPRAPNKSHQRRGSNEGEGYDYTVIDKTGKRTSVYPDTYVNVYPDSYDAYFLVPKRKKRSSGEVWGEYSLVNADRGYSFDYSYPMKPKKPQANDSSDSYTGYIYPEFIDTFTPLPKRVPAPSSVIGAPAGDRT